MEGDIYITIVKVNIAIFQSTPSAWRETCHTFCNKVLL